MRVERIGAIHRREIHLCNLWMHNKYNSDNLYILKFEYTLGKILKYNNKIHIII